MHIDEERRVFDIVEDCIYYFNADGRIHRDGDKPAIVCKGQFKGWVKNGWVHRGDDPNKPAVVFKNGCKQWYVEGGLHSERGKCDGLEIIDWVFQAEDMYGVN